MLTRREFSKMIPTLLVTPSILAATGRKVCKVEEHINYLIENQIYNNITLIECNKINLLKYKNNINLGMDKNTLWIKHPTNINDIIQTIKNKLISQKFVEGEYIYVPIFINSNDAIKHIDYYIQNSSHIVVYKYNNFYNLVGVEK